MDACCPLRLDVLPFSRLQKDSWEAGDNSSSWSRPSPAAVPPPPPPRDLLGARTPSPPEARAAASNGMSANKAKKGWDDDIDLDVDAYVAGLSIGGDKQKPLPTAGEEEDAPLSLCLTHPLTDG